MGLFFYIKKKATKIIDSDSDDFYEDHYEDFDDFEDADDYYEDHMD